MRRGCLALQGTAGLAVALGSSCLRLSPRRIFPSSLILGAVPVPLKQRDYERPLRRVAPEVMMEVRWSAKPKTVPSHLLELFDLAVETGRRLSAVCQLTYADLRMDPGPFGSVKWPGRSDKQKREQTVPLTPVARAAVDRVLRERPGIGDTPLFPSPWDPTRSMTRHLADKWLRRAERLAGIPSQDGSLWHAYRRRWATVRKHLPAQDVAKAGGWASVGMVENVYT